MESLFNHGEVRYSQDFFHFLDIKDLQAMPIYTLNSWIFKIQEKKISTPLYYSARATITEYHRLGGLNNRIFIFSWFWKLEVQDQDANKVVACYGLSCVVNICFFLCTHIAFLQRWRWWWWRRDLWCIFLHLLGHKFNRMRGPPLWPHLALITYI